MDVGGGGGGGVGGWWGWWWREGASIVLLIPVPIRRGFHLPDVLASCIVLYSSSFSHSLTGFQYTDELQSRSMHFEMSVLSGFLCILFFLSKGCVVVMAQGNLNFFYFLFFIYIIYIFF